MVLRIEEREEAIQLLAMDPQVCVNYSRFIRRAIELMQKPSVIESPSGRVPEKVPRWDLTGTEGCGSGKVSSWLPWWFGDIIVYIGERNRSVESRGAHKGGGVPHPPERALRPCGLLVASLTSSPSLWCVFWSKKNNRNGFIPFGLRLVFLFCETLKLGKNRNWHWALG